MSAIDSLRALAHALGVYTHFTDGRHRSVEVAPATLLRACAALGASVAKPEDAPAALRALEADRERRRLPRVLVAWDGRLSPVEVPDGAHAALTLESGSAVGLVRRDGHVSAVGALPLGYHRLTVESANEVETATVLSAPMRCYQRPGPSHGWGVGTHLAALRSARSRTVGDLRDLQALSRWVGERGGDVVTVLPLLPTFNRPPAEPSPYSPVSRLFWSELILDLGQAHKATPPAELLDLEAADTEVRNALGGRTPDPAAPTDPELLRYARFRGAQARYGRNWRDWPAHARAGRLGPDDADPEEERFHLVAQLEVRGQLKALRGALDDQGVRLGLDLAVGVHPDGYDPWAWPALFAEGISVGAPPDPGFPSGQDWGFPPVLPTASRQQGHRYLAAAIRHQAALCGLLRIDHVMALSRLYWIPSGMDRSEGTYVTYPLDELFAVLTLESVRNRCEIVGENLGTVPPEIGDALARHRVPGMYLAEFGAYGHEVRAPGPREVAMIGTHDTPTFVGWTRGIDIEERVRFGLMPEEGKAEELEQRRQAVHRLASHLGGDPDDEPDFLSAVLEWLGRSSAPLVIPWLEDLWLEARSVNLPGTSSRARPNWRRPMARLLDDVVADPAVQGLAQGLDDARPSGAVPTPTDPSDTSVQSPADPEPPPAPPSR